MPDLLQVLLPYIVGGVLLLAAGLFVLALWYFRRSRLEPYWRMRRDASRTGWRLFLAALLLFGMVLLGAAAAGLTSWLLQSQTPEVTASAAPTRPPTLTMTRVPASPAPSPTASATLPQAASPAPSATRTASPIPPTETATRQPSPTGTATPRPTRTPAPTATAVLITPLEAGVPLPEGADLTIAGVAARVDSDLGLLETSLTLPAGLTRIYFALAYSGMAEGAAWERGLYRGETLVQGGAYLWRSGERGTALHFFGDAAGFPAGDYTIRITFSGEPAAELDFVLE